MVVVHGDDFIGEGELSAVEHLASVLRANFEVKIMPYIGPGHATSGKILKRELLWCSVGFGWLPDGRHIQRAAADLGLTGAKAAPTPAVKESECRVRDADDQLTPGETYVYRSVNGRLLYLSADRVDIQFALKESSRGMTTPLKRHELRLRRVVRYLLGTGNLMLIFRYQQFPDKIDVYVDGDWAGDLETRRSTSCDIALFGKHLLESHAVTQQVLALSSAESEFYALGSGAATGLFIKHLLAEQGRELRLVLHTDSSAARSMVQRTGVGRVRHIQARFLWIQEEQRGGRLTVMKVAGSENPADLGTKAVTRDTLEKLLSKLPLALPDLADGWGSKAGGYNSRDSNDEKDKEIAVKAKTHQSNHSE